MTDTLNHKDITGKNEQDICCPFCSLTRIIRHGTYLRNHPERNEQVRVQRLLCKNTQCPVKTFSVLTYPFLRIVRHWYWTVEQVYCLMQEGFYQASIARVSGVMRGVSRYLMDFSKHIFPWIDREQPIADWGSCFETDPCRIWPQFIRDFSYRFYPNRYGKHPPTQLIHF